jgi:hypothetical protein
MMFIDALQQVRGQHIGLHKLIPAAIESMGRLSGYPASFRRGFPCVLESVVLPRPITQALPPGPGIKKNIYVQAGARQCGKTIHSAVMPMPLDQRIRIRLDFDR